MSEDTEEHVHTITRNKKRIVSVKASVEAESDKAFLIDNGGVDVWLPKSQICIDSAVFLVPFWLVEKNKLQWTEDE